MLAFDEAGYRFRCDIRGDVFGGADVNRVEDETIQSPFKLSNVAVEFLRQQVDNLVVNDAGTKVPCRDFRTEN